MKRRIWIVVTACVAAVLICAACLIGVTAHRGIGVSKAVYIETSAGPMVLLHGSPVRVSGKEKLFEGLTMGDQVLLVHGPVMESYPGQTKGYLCIKRADGTEEDIPVEVLQSLREMGWLPITLWLENSAEVPGVDGYVVYELDCIELAKSMVHWDYYEVAVEQDAETGNFMVAFSSRDREKFQVVIVGQPLGPWPVRFPVNRDEAIAIADAYKTFDYDAATAGQNPETDEWTVTFWSRDQETSQEVIVSQYYPVLDGV